MPSKYTVSDGKLVLLLQQAQEGGYIVTSPLEPELITEAEMVSEAFENARDALKALRDSRPSFYVEPRGHNRRFPGIGN